MTASVAAARERETREDVELERHLPPVIRDLAKPAESAEAVSTFLHIQNVRD